MKTLEEFLLIKEFLGGQGIKPTMAMVCATNEGWADLKYLAREWRDAREAEIARQQEEMEGLSEEELAFLDKKAEEERRLEQERLLYHSSGYRPEKS